MSEMEALSPLAGHAEPGLFGNWRDDSGVMLQERLPACLLQVSAWPETLDAVESVITSVTGCAVAQRPGGSSHNARSAVLNIGPGRYLLDSSDADLPAKLAEQIDPARGSLADLTHGRIAIRIAGPQAVQVLAKGLAIDLHTEAFPPMQVVQSAIHEIAVVARRLTDDSFDLYVYRGFALSLWEWLTDASSEAGYRVLPATRS